MDNNRQINQILEKFYKVAIREIEKGNGEVFLRKLNDNQRNWLFKVVSNAESFKAIVTVFTTSFF